MSEFQWTGMGCDVCGFGSVENISEFDPCKPCPKCEAVMVRSAPIHEPDACSACGETVSIHCRRHYIRRIRELEAEVVRLKADAASSLPGGRYA